MHFGIEFDIDKSYVISIAYGVGRKQALLENWQGYSACNGEGGGCYVSTFPAMLLIANTHTGFKITGQEGQWIADSKKNEGP